MGSKSAAVSVQPREVHTSYNCRIGGLGGHRSECDRLIGCSPAVQLGASGLAIIYQYIPTLAVEVRVGKM